MKLKKLIKKSSAISSLVFFFALLVTCSSSTPALAESFPRVVINEVAWAGSFDSANDEWIELYNTTDQPIDLSGWKIEDDQGSSSYSLSGQIAPFSYFLIEDSEEAVQPNMANNIINLSLANAGDSLALLDQNNQVVDSVNDSGGSWYFGDAETKASMERIDYGAGNAPSHWGTSVGGSGAISSGGSAIMGTPGALNTASAIGDQTGAPRVTLIPSLKVVKAGDTLTVVAHVTDVAELFSYGFEIHYDPAILTYNFATPGPFLGEDGTVTTSFQAGLENGIAGKILVAEARTQSVKSGIGGDGDLFSLQFTVIENSPKPISLTFNPSSFLASPLVDIPAQFSHGEISFAEHEPDPVSHLLALEGADRYSILVKWDASSDAVDGYKVYREDRHGIWKLLSQVAALQTTFNDKDPLNGGGNIIPHHQYHYRVTAVRTAAESAPVEIFGAETRGLKGDNDRSDRVDGRDLEKLAQHFAAVDTDPNFPFLVDTTYDGEIDGSDLIDLGANFALTYSG